MDTKKAKAIYRKILPKIIKDKGKIVAIDPETGDYFIGKTVLEACDKGQERYPDKIFFCHRIGFKFTYFMGHYEIPV